jgi:uncharacterized protein (DUF697 family)
MSASNTIEISDGALTIVAGYSALAGLCPLIPVPFVDDFIIVRIHRRMCRDLCNRHDFYLSDDAARILTDKPSKILSGIFRKILFWPIKKLITKVVYVLAVKSCADVAAVIFHEGWLLARVLEKKYVPLDALRQGDSATLERLRDAIIAAREHVDPSPTQAVMRSAYGVGREVFSSTLSELRKTLVRSGTNDERMDAAEQKVAPITQRIQDEVRKHWLSGPLLDAELRKALGLA